MNSFIPHKLHPEDLSRLSDMGFISANGLGYFVGAEGWELSVTPDVEINGECWRYEVAANHKTVNGSGVKVQNFHGFVTKRLRIGNDVENYLHDCGYPVLKIQRLRRLRALIE